MIKIKNKTRAGASKFNAVPPIVWSAFKLMEAKASNKAKIAPAAHTIKIISGRMA